jgi:GTPase SAR1 family protein
MPENEKKITLVIGKRGSGKSCLVKYLIREARRLVIYDVMAEYKQGVCFSVENTDQFLSFWYKTYKRDFRLIWRPLKVKDEVEAIARGVYVLGNITFVVEEIDAVCTAWIMPEWLSYCVQRGRHKNIELIGVTPAPFGINRDLTRQAKRIIVFNTTEPKDLDYLAALMGSAVKEIVPALGQYEFMDWRDDNEKIYVGKLQANGIEYRHAKERSPSDGQVSA